MGTETKSNSYTGQISTSGGNPKVMKDSLSLVCQTVKQQQTTNQINSNSNSNTNTNTKTFSSEQQQQNAKQEDKTTITTTTASPTTPTTTTTTTVKEAIVPFVPIFVEEADVIQGAKDILKVIRPNWDLNHVDFKVK